MSPFSCRGRPAGSGIIARGLGRRLRAGRSGCRRGRCRRRHGWRGGRRRSHGLGGPAGDDRAPASGFGLGIVDLFRAHPGFEHPHQLAGTVAELVDPGSAVDEIRPFVGIDVVLRYAAADRVEPREDQHGMGVTLIGGAGEPPERLFVGAGNPDAGRIERTEIELGLVVAGLRRAQIAARHILVEHRISRRLPGVCQEGDATEDRENKPLHENALKSSTRWRYPRP